VTKLSGRVKQGATRTELVPERAPGDRLYTVQAASLRLLRAPGTIRKVLYRHPAWFSEPTYVHHWPSRRLTRVLTEQDMDRLYDLFPLLVVKRKGEGRG
jgi:hypothetical protein